MNAVNPQHGVTVRADLIGNLVDLLSNYGSKRIEIERFNEEVDSGLTGGDLQIAGISVSLDAVRSGLQAELSRLEVELDNRFNIRIGRPLPKIKEMANVAFEQSELKQALDGLPDIGDHDYDVVAVDAVDADEDRYGEGERGVSGA